MTDRAAAPASERPLPPLPEPTVWTLFPYGVIRAYTAAQVNAHVLADRAAQAVPLPATVSEALRLADEFYNGTAEKDWAAWGQEAVVILERAAAYHGIVPLAPQGESQ